MKKKIIIGIILVIIIIIAYFATKSEVIAPIIPDSVINDINQENTKPTELCFAKFGTPNNDGLYDKYTLRLMLDGEKATGELNFLPAEKDKKIGEFKGTVGPVDKKMMARTADLWWFTFAEGMNTEEQLRIIFGEGTASVGFGEMVDRGDGVYVYKDPNNLSYTLNLTDVSCSDLAERVNVESYLKDNIEELSPVKAVFGGKWYIVSTTIDLAKNTGIVIYEDGHIQEEKSFSYVANSKGEIESLSIK